MNPVVYRLGQIEIHIFTVWIAAGVVLGLALTLGLARYHQQNLLPWLDAAIGAVVGGVAGARTIHIWLNWSYFAAHTDQIVQLNTGGLDWHGAVIGGLIGAILAAALRRVPLLRLLDVLALAFPLGTMTGWQACAVANCGYGLEVRTLADYPAWLVIESPDVYGIVAPRLNLPPLGIALGAGVFIVIVLLTLTRKLRGTRLWLAILLFSLGMAVIDFFRTEYVPLWFDHRADQILDLGLALGAVFIFAAVLVIQRRYPLALHRSISI